MYTTRQVTRSIRLPSLPYTRLYLAQRHASVLATLPHSAEAEKPATVNPPSAPNAPNTPTSSSSIASDKVPTPNEVAPPTTAQKVRLTLSELTKMLETSQNLVSYLEQRYLQDAHGGASYSLGGSDLAQEIQEMRLIVEGLCKDMKEMKAMVTVRRNKAE
ncbi:hypothetical protein BZG36_00600 [Bifiguratus adelaidae]|uniref:Uncharacterized protein n=1 Tax=Bifiguratus adelaidae TaxID=1938954 RepID=A0A261Y7H4_9FUNG|nr:hypothetical protein BZG36_00600 [Bifiguratus adelaidae]